MSLTYSRISVYSLVFFLFLVQYIWFLKLQLMIKRNKERLTITLDTDILKLVDRFIDGKRIRNRSHAIEYLISQQLKPKIRQAVILASGKGVKMRPFTYELPKSMLPVKGRPILGYTIDLLRDANIRDIIIVVSHLSDKIRTYFGDGSKFGVSIRYIEESKPTGTASSLRKVKAHIHKDPFVLLYGDVLADIDLHDFISVHENSDALATIALKTTHEPGVYGVVKLKGNRVVKFTEKPLQSAESSALINAGVMILDSSIFSSFPPARGAMLERDVLEKLTSTERVFGYPFAGAWYDVGTPEVYQNAVQHWKKRV